MSKLESLSDSLKLYNGRIVDEEEYTQDPNSDSTMLSEKDLSDEALAQYVRSADEVKI